MAEEIKQPPTASTATRTGLVAGLSLSPVAIGPVFGYIFQVIHAVWPVIPEPSDVQTLNMAIVIMAVASAVVAWRVRGTAIVNDYNGGAN